MGSVRGLAHEDDPFVALEEFGQIARVINADGPPPLSRVGQILVPVGYQAAVVRGLEVYLEYERLAADDPELLEYISNLLAREKMADMPNVALGQGVTQAEVNELRSDVVQLWGKVIGLARKSVRGAE